MTTSGWFRFSSVGVSFSLATISCPLFVATSSMILPIFPYPTSAILISKNLKSVMQAQPGNGSLTSVFIKNDSRFESQVRIVSSFIQMRIYYGIHNVQNVKQACDGNGIIAVSLPPILFAAQCLFQVLNIIM